MQNKHVSTFLSGTTELVLEAIEKSIKSPKVELSLDGLVVYETESEVKEIINLDFFNNTFLLLKQFDDLRGNYFRPMFQWANRNNFKNIKNTVEDMGFKTFRVVVSDANQIVSYDKRVIALIEERVAKDLNLKVNRLNPDTEVWFLRRSEGYGFVLLRLTNSSKAEHRSKGQLRPELANLMCILASPNKNDVILEPFAGHGTIVEQLKNMPHKEIIAFEKDSKVGDGTDFFSNGIPENYVSKIVTDPPWGLFNSTLDIKKFYTNMFREFNRVLTTEGKVVVLLTRELDISEYLSGFGLRVESKFDVLVSGKKAILYKLGRSPR
jgi:tRNA G10  N-methylase Trm11